MVAEAHYIACLRLAEQCGKTANHQRPCALFRKTGLIQIVPSAYDGLDSRPAGECNEPFGSYRCRNYGVESLSP